MDPSALDGGLLDERTTQKLHMYPRDVFKDVKAFEFICSGAKLSVVRRHRFLLRFHQLPVYVQSINCLKTALSMGGAQLLRQCCVHIRPVSGSWSGHQPILSSGLSVPSCCELTAGVESKRTLFL